MLRFRHKLSDVHQQGGASAGPPAASLLLLPRSLVVFEEAAFTDCLHGIEEVGAAPRILSSCSATSLQGLCLA